MRGRILAGIVLVSIAASAHGRENQPPPQAVREAAKGTVTEDLGAIFERGLFGYMPVAKPDSAPPVEKSADMARAQLAMQLTLRIDEIERLVPLLEAGKKKLRAAGELDIRRYFDRIEQIKEGFRSPSGERTMGVNVATARTRLRHEFEAGLFGSGSYFAKVLDTMVDDQQAVALQRAAADRNRARRQTRALLMAQSWGDALSLDSEQRRKLFEVIAEQIPLPERNGLNDYPYLVYQFGIIPRDRLRLIFDEAQWKILSPKLDQYKSKKHKDRLIELGYDLGESNPAKPKPETEPAK